MAMVPRPAATLILLRDGAQGVEVLMMQRAKESAFLGGAYVFPGGSLDAEDAGGDDALAKYRYAAVRECFEEAGILLLEDKHKKIITEKKAASLAAYRNKSFQELLKQEKLRVPHQALAHYGHWITSPGAARRFETHFFLAVAPAGQEGSHDPVEAVHQIWIRPADALERGARGEIDLVFATRTTLGDLKQFSSATEAFAAVRARPAPETNRACWAQGKDGPKLFRRADAPYFEIHWSDPEETGQSTYDLTAGVAKRLDRYVTRLIAPNPGMMTGPGTNTYLVGEREIAVIDPGPDVASHLEKILSFKNVKWILCTHTHVDHSPGAAPLKAATGAQVLGMSAPAGQDATFKPDFVLEHGQRVDLGEVSLRAVHTPGHASNHLCYLLEQTKMLFTGDHVMQGSTVVINPPDGDMRAYFGSLEKLLAEDLAILAPGHGYLIGDPHQEVRRLIAHRMAREQKVVSSLKKFDLASLEELLPLVYDDVPPRIHHVAARSLSAHLDKLIADGAVRQAGGRFALVKSPRAG
ncbi:MAG TPA: MBL fold metallo-hydrolase [Burkholderiales bacterium]